MEGGSEEGRALWQQPRKTGEQMVHFAMTEEAAFMWVGEPAMGGRLLSSLVRQVPLTHHAVASLQTDAAFCLLPNLPATGAGTPYAGVVPCGFIDPEYVYLLQPTYRVNNL